MSRKKRVLLQQKQRAKKQQEKAKKTARQQHDPAKWEEKKAAKARARHEAGLDQFHKRNKRCNYKLVASFLYKITKNVTKLILLRHINKGG